MEYRVYDKKKKKWVTDVYMTPDGELFKVDKSILGLAKPTFVSQNRYIFQKSISLHDKNGTLIYVGDYIKAAVADNKEIVGIVTFAEELSSYIILSFDTDEYFTLGESVSDRIEVVGNIFEDK